MTGEHQRKEASAPSWGDSPNSRRNRIGVFFIQMVANSARSDEQSTDVRDALNHETVSPFLREENKNTLAEQTARVKLDTEVGKANLGGG